MVRTAKQVAFLKKLGYYGSTAKAPQKARYPGFGYTKPNKPKASSREGTPVKRYPIAARRVEGGTRKTNHSHRTHRTRDVYTVSRGPNVAKTVAKTRQVRQSRPSTSDRPQRHNGTYSLQNKEIGPCPDRYFCTLKWTEAYTFNLTTPGTTNRQVWGGNNAWDPNLASGVSEPMGWDQIEVLYGKYICHASHITLKLTNETAIGVEWVLYPRTDTTAAPATYLEARENQYAIWGVVSARDSGKSQATVKHKMMTKKMYGLDDISEDPNFIADTTSPQPNPAQQWYWQLVTLSDDGSTAFTLIVDILIEYKLEFGARRYLPRSTH